VKSDTFPLTCKKTVASDVAAGTLLISDDIFRDILLVMGSPKGEFETIEVFNFSTLTVDKICLEWAVRYSNEVLR
jgi:hypothetical protein